MMTGLEGIIAAFIFVCGLVGLVILFGRAAARAEQRGDELDAVLEKQRRLSKLLSIRTRSRDELIDWLHKKSGRGGSSVPPTGRDDG